jgi:hypothetical protein
VPIDEVHAHDAHVQAESEMQHGHDALHAQDDAVHGHERLQDVHGQIHGTLLPTMRHEDDRLLRSKLHHDLQFGLHVDGNAREQYDRMHDENGRIFDDVLHGFQLVRTNDALVQPLQRLFDENDELVLHVKGEKNRLAVRKDSC